MGSIWKNILLIIETLIISVVTFCITSKYIPDTKIQLLVYFAVIFIWLWIYLKWNVHKYHFNENYRNIKKYRKIVILIIFILILIGLAVFAFYQLPSLLQLIVGKKNKDNTIDINKIASVIKVFFPTISAPLIVKLGSKSINNFINGNDVVIQLFGVATFYNHNHLELMIPNDTDEFALSLHNFSKNTVKAFYLGVCEENSVKDLLDKKDWNKEFIDGKLPKGPQDFEKIKPNKNSKLQKIEVTKIKEFFEKEPYYNKTNGYKLCAVYYIQEEKNTDLIKIEKHFTLEYDDQEKVERRYLKKIINETQYHNLAMQIREYAATIPDKNHKELVLREADLIDPTVSPKDNEHK